MLLLKAIFKKMNFGMILLKLRIQKILCKTIRNKDLKLFWPLQKP